MWRNSRDSMLTPLNGSFDRRAIAEKYEFDGELVGPTPFGVKLKAQAGGLYTTIRTNLVKDKSS
jgi:hypothetical protein